jgi:glyoxylase-like metal-dependent hydrolase (beta-lactamase superfamily II)
MAEILPGIHVVEGVEGTHVFLVKDTGPTWTLIDTGIPGSDAGIAQYLAKIKVDPHAVKKILLTHLHRDHTGGLKRTVALTGARTFAHWIEAAYIAGKPPYDGPGSPPLDHVAIDEPLKDGDTIDAGGGLHLYHTPGHTPGHCAYYQAERKVLFCGDLFFGAGPNSIMLTTPEYTLHTPTAQISARRVGQLAIESLFTNHGGPYPKAAGAVIRSLVQKL